jgi:dynein heavy chain
VAKLKAALRVCGEFKRVYYAYKATAGAECPGNPWRIQNTALFLRLDGFLERCHDVLEMTQVILQVRGKGRAAAREGARTLVRGL